MRGLTGKDRIYLWAMISSETQVSGVPPQYWAWGQLHFLVITWFPSLAGPGEEQDLGLRAPSPRLTRKGQTGGQVWSLLGPPAMRLLLGLILASSFFVLSLQKPRSWRKDAGVLKQGQGW